MSWSDIKSWAIPIGVVVLGCSSVGFVAHHSLESGANQTPSPNTSTQTVSATEKNAAAENMVDRGTPMYGRPAPDFTLTNQFGKRVSLSQFKGKVVLLSFVDSECTTICPLTTQEVMDAVNQLGSQARQHIEILGVNANPTAYSVSDVMKYSKEHNMVNQWNFLTGNLSELKSVWKKYNIESQIVNGQIDHTPALYVIDAKGKEQMLYMTPPTYSSAAAETSILSHDIEKYLPKNVRVHLPTVPPKAVTESSVTPISLPTVHNGRASGKMTLKPGKPRLTAFFASWVPNAKTALQQLSAYAKQPGSPSVAAVDEETTEPSANWFVNWTKTLPSQDMPVAIDSTGVVADAYHATDLMWLTLTDAQGNIIWAHDGWMPMKQLQSTIQYQLATSSSK